MGKIGEYLIVESDNLVFEFSVSFLVEDGG